NRGWNGFPASPAFAFGDVEDEIELAVEPLWKIAPRHHGFGRYAGSCQCCHDRLNRILGVVLFPLVFDDGYGFGLAIVEDRDSQSNRPLPDGRGSVPSGSVVNRGSEVSTRERFQLFATRLQASSDEHGIRPRKSRWLRPARYAG